MRKDDTDIRKEKFSSPYHIDFLKKKPDPVSKFTVNGIVNGMYILYWFTLQNIAKFGVKHQSITLQKKRLLFNKSKLCVSKQHQLCHQHIFMSTEHKLTRV